MICSFSCFLHAHLSFLCLQLTALSTLLVSSCRCRFLLLASSQSGPASTWLLLVSPTFPSFSECPIKQFLEELKNWMQALSRVQWWSQHFLENVDAGSYDSIKPFPKNVSFSLVRIMQPWKSLFYPAVLPMLLYLLTGWVDMFFFKLIVVEHKG